ncbi:MAG: hypothetical protein ACP5H2_03020 [Solirubrobacteraceae bacterium]
MDSPRDVQQLKLTGASFERTRMLHGRSLKVLAASVSALAAVAVIVAVASLMHGRHGQSRTLPLAVAGNLAVRLGGERLRPTGQSVDHVRVWVAHAAASTTAHTAGAATVEAAGSPSTPGTGTAVTPSGSYVATDGLSAAAAAQQAAAGSANFLPPAFLMPYYTALARRYDVPWRLVAALSYVQSAGYGNVISGAQARSLRATARQVDVSLTHAVNGDVLAGALNTALQPPAELSVDVARLAAQGARVDPASAIQSVTGSSQTTDAVLTVDQAISQVPSSSVRPTPRQRIAAMLREANLLDGLPYVWGGGHETPAWLVQGGFDCSGFVSAVLHAGGYLDSPQTTQTLPAVADILPDPGRYVTIYDRTINTTKFTQPSTPAAKSGQLSVSQATKGVHLNTGAGRTVNLQLSPQALKAIEQATIQKGNEQDNTINDEHVIIDINGQWWESGGDTKDGGAASVHRIAEISEAYLKSFNKVLHPAGL